MPSRHTETRCVFFANASANAFAAALPNRVRLKSKETTDAFRASASAIATHPASSKPLRAKLRRSTLVALDRERIAPAIAIASADPKPFAETSTSKHGEVSRNAASATADFAPSAFSARFILVSAGASASAASNTAPSASRTSQPRSSTTARPAGRTT